MPGLVDKIFFYYVSDYNPGKTLIVGASYVGLECAGFLNGVGNDVTVMVRSIFLRGFDQQCADIVGNHLEKEGVKMQRPCTMKSIEKGSQEHFSRRSEFKDRKNIKK